MEKTSYTIKQKEFVCTIFENGTLFASTFCGIEAALHAIWVSNGSVPSHFYKCIDGVVFKLELCNE